MKNISILILTLLFTNADAQIYIFDGYPAGDTYTYLNVNEMDSIEYVILEWHGQSTYLRTGNESGYLSLKTLELPAPESYKQLSHSNRNKLVQQIKKEHIKYLSFAQVLNVMYRNGWEYVGPENNQDGLGSTGSIFRRIK